MTSASNQFRERDRSPIYEWAANNISLRAPYTITCVPGFDPFDVERSRHFKKIFDTLQDPYCRETNILKPIRGGGTMIADIWSGWTRDCDPGPLMFVLQTGDIADEHAERKLMPVWRSIPSVRAMIENLPSKKVCGTSIAFADGNTLQINGPSVTHLQTNAFRYVVMDECWLWDSGRMGDAEGRIGDYQKIELSKILRVSQGGSRQFRPLHECDWNRAYYQGCIWEWTIQCSHCGHRMQPQFSAQRDDGSYWGLNWDKHKLLNGDWDVARAAPTVRFNCEKCDWAHTNCRRTQSDWNRTGEYVLTMAMNRKKQGFHWNALIDFPWEELCELWLNACNAFERGDPMPKLQFYQKRLAMMMDEETMLRRGVALTRLVYDVNSEWADELYRFLTIDRQDEDKFWWTVRSWSKERTRRLGFGMCYGFAALEEIRERFKVHKTRTLIDSGHLPKGDYGVYQACARYGWIALKGDKEASYVHIKGHSGGVALKVLKSFAPTVRKDANVGKAGPHTFCLLVRFSKNAMNQAVEGLIKSGRWEEPSGQLDQKMEVEYQEQMGARIRKSGRNKRGETEVWYQEMPNDHARDLANEQCCAAMMVGVMPDPATESTLSFDRAQG